MQVLPFFRASEAIRLTYSDRIGNCTPGSIPETFIGSFDEVADQLRQSMEHFGLIEQLQRPYTVRDFLKQYDRADYETRGINYEVFDIACAAAMVGEVGRPERFLRRLKHTHEETVRQAGSDVPDFKVHLYDQVTACLDALAQGPSHLRDHIVVAIARNARRLGFEPVGPDGA